MINKKKLIVASSTPEFKLIKQTPLFDYIIKNNIFVKKSKNLEEARNRVNNIFFNNRENNYKNLNKKLYQETSRLSLQYLDKFF